jgi:transposase
MGARNRYTKEFKAGAVQLVLDRGRSASDVARSLGVKPNSVQRWVQQARVDRGQGRPDQLTTDEQAELGRLRRRVKELETEKAILKKAAALFAKESA